MCVVDRRSSARHERGRNRAKEAEMPAPVQVPTQHHAQHAAVNEVHGVEVVTQTAGAEALRALLLQRVWGVSRPMHTRPS